MRTNLIKPKIKESVKSKANNVDMIIAFDTTGSMFKFINDVKNHITQLIPQLFNDNPNLRLGIVAFGDYCDMKSKEDFGNAYQKIDLTDNQESLIKFVINARDTCGGDSDEFYELVIKKIVEETSWREDSIKSVLLIADCWPHSLGYSCYPFIDNNQIDWRKEAKKAADKGIKFDTTTCGSASWFKELSDITNGICIPFKKSGNTSEVIKASNLAKGGVATMDAFYKSMEDNKDNLELYAVYTAYSKEVVTK